MRKAGWITAAIGAVLTGLLFLVRRSGWYAEQQAMAMSDFGELADSAFWASVLTVLFGLFLLLLSLRRAEPAPESDVPAPMEATWICPGCGSENTESDRSCRLCGARRQEEPSPGWVCPGCGAENNAEDLLCPVCGAARPEQEDEAVFCPICGSELQSWEAERGICPACGSPLPDAPAAPRGR